MDIPRYTDTTKCMAIEWCTVKFRNYEQRRLRFLCFIPIHISNEALIWITITYNHILYLWKKIVFIELVRCRKFYKSVTFSTKLGRKWIIKESMIELIWYMDLWIFKYAFNILQVFWINCNNNFPRGICKYVYS
jgi:hypothetical protein